MSTLNIAEAIEKFSVEIDDHHDRQAAIPVGSGLIRQGDVIVVPASMAGRLAEATTPVPAAGFAVVQGEATANTHLLIGEGVVFFDPTDGGASGLAIGTLTVGDGAIAYLAHPEHAYTGIAPGTYEVRRQREQADEIRLVAD